MAQGFLGGHAEAYRAFLLNSRDVVLRELPMIGGELTWNAFREIHCAGTVEVLAEPWLDEVNWLTAKVAVQYVAEFYGQRIEKQLMIGYVDKPDPDPVNGTVQLEVLDKLYLLQQGSTDYRFSFPPGTNVITAVVGILMSLGQTNIAVTEHSGTLINTVVIDPATSWLTAINKLLNAINYAPIWVNGAGTFQIHPYRDPGERMPVHEFTPENSTYTPEILEERDLYHIPNKVHCQSTTDGETEAMVAVALNDDPTNPYSIPAREGLVITRREEDVEAVDLPTLQAIADRLLVSSSQVTWRQTLHHIWADLNLNEVVVGPNGLEFSVVEMDQVLEAGALTRTVIRRMDNMLGVTL